MKRQQCVNNIALCVSSSISYVSCRRRCCCRCCYDLSFGTDQSDCIIVLNLFIHEPNSFTQSSQKPIEWFTICVFASCFIVFFSCLLSLCFRPRATLSSVFCLVFFKQAFMCFSINQKSKITYQFRKETKKQSNFNFNKQNPDENFMPWLNLLNGIPSLILNIKKRCIRFQNRWNSLWYWFWWRVNKELHSMFFHDVSKFAIDLCVVFGTVAFAKKFHANVNEFLPFEEFV